MRPSLLSLLLLLSGAGPAAARDYGPLPAPPRVERLPSGLTVVTLPQPGSGVVAYYTLVRVGARDEVEPGHSGFAHLFEHMMFRGTERFPSDVYEERIQRLGADNNAYTMQDFTLYTVTAPRAALADIVELEADRFQHLSYSEEEFRTETGAVLGEYNKSAASPFLEMWEALSELSFREHTYGHTTIGYLDDIRAMPERLDYSRAFFRRFYTPDNCTVIVAGDVTHEEVLAVVEPAYATFTGTRDQPKVPLEPEPTQGAERHLDWQAPSPPKMMIGYRTPAFCSTRGPVSAECVRDTAALEVVHGLLFSASSPLYQRLVVEQQRLLDFGSWTGSFSVDPGLFVVLADLKAGTSFDEIRDAVQAAVEALARGEVSEEGFAATRSHLRYRLTMDVETASDAAELVARLMAPTGEVEALPSYLEALSAVTVEDVARVCRTYLVPRRRFVVTLAPSAEPAP